MRESRSYGFVRGVPGDRHPYRDTQDSAVLRGFTIVPRACFTTSMLDASQEFRRMGDNNVYHKGYPICYRSLPFVPSIQVSATRDKTRADVDVDFRKFEGYPDHDRHDAGGANEGPFSSFKFDIQFTGTHESAACER
jgi:hypothetical protein